MAMSSIFRSVGTRPLKNANVEVYGNDASWLVDNGQFAWDSTNVTPTLGNVGGRPCLNLTNSGSTATDLSQFQTTAASILMATDAKTHVLKFSYRGTTATQDIAFGWAAIDTTIIASDPTDFIMFRKLAAETTFTLRTRKASGTAYTVSATPVIAADAWYDGEIRATYSATANMSRVQVFMSANASPGAPLTQVLDSLIPDTAFPNTVNMASFGAWRAGSAANVSGYISYFGSDADA